MIATVLVWLIAKEAAASGSSHVEAVSGAVRVTADTPSISFAEEQDEGRWHRDWRADAQPLVDRAVGLAAAEVATWKRKERKLLTPWTPELRVAQSWAQPSESWSLEASPGPVCYESPMGLPDAPGMTISMLQLCFAEPPARDVADALVERVRAAVSAATDDL